MLLTGDQRGSLGGQPRSKEAHGARTRLCRVRRHQLREALWNSRLQRMLRIF